MEPEETQIDIPQRIDLLHGRMILKKNGQNTKIDYAILNSEYLFSEDTQWKIVELLNQYNPKHKARFFKMLTEISEERPDTLEIPKIIDVDITIHRGYIIFTLPNNEIKQFLGELLPLLQDSRNYVVGYNDGGGWKPI
ncbi:MAG TPA: hypothetical protein VIH48_01615 [Candidatus Bathyarchaeia archaeon]